MQVDSAGFVADMEARLLIAGQARHAHTAKGALVEGSWRIVELLATEVGLAAMPGCIEDHRMNVDPPAPLGNHLDTNRSPVSLHTVASAFQSAQCLHFSAGVHREVEVTV